MRYGHSVEDGFLPVMSVNTEAEAKSLLTLSCATNVRGEFIAKELAAEQTMENLETFGLRLEEMYLKYIAPKKS